jgi:hypothetical protein
MDRTTPLHGHRTITKARLTLVDGDTATDTTEPVAAAIAA